MNTDNPSEETEVVKLEEQENTDNYTSIITFNQRLYEKIITKELSLKDYETIGRFLNSKSNKTF